MPRDNLVDVFRDLAATPGPFLVRDTGYRAWKYTYGETAGAARAFAVRLQEEGLAAGTPILFWSENNPEWVAAFWGAILAGCIVVPLDARSAPEFVERVGTLVEARLLLTGREVDPPPPLADRFRLWPLAGLDWQDRRTPASVASPSANDTAEIIFTSGATGDPKGVVITHANVLANLIPIERGIDKYRWMGRPFFPLGILDLLPLSHMFGQALATFIPPALPATVLFMSGQNPAAVVERVRRRRISVLVGVPKMLEMLRDHVTTRYPESLRPLSRPRHVAVRWWLYRRIHRAFGPWFWCFVVGGAPLDPGLEEFWSRLGFLVIQGYGLTEAAPIVSLNHPFAARRGSVGKPIAGVEVKIADDGEILVRGANVTQGYFGNPEATRDAFEEGWLRTGDIGELDEDGRILIRGRKKDTIVTPEGLNVFPEDVERVLDALPGVRESAVVGGPLSETRGERVHAVLVTEPGTDTGALIRAANARLADHQRVRGVTIWPGGRLPRTAGTEKLKRSEVRHWLAGSISAPAARHEEGAVVSLLQRHAGNRDIRPETTLEELGLTSLERIELLMSLEAGGGRELDEARFAEARTVADLQGLVAGGAADEHVRQLDWSMPRWNRSLAARAIRRASLPTWILPPLRLIARGHVEGRAHLDALRGPVVFASNHQSHLDTPLILAAMPPALRYRVGVAMAQEYFDAHFHPVGKSIRRRLASGLAYFLAALFFNAFPLPQREAGAKRSLQYVGELLEEGFSVLLFPEGRRTGTGAIGPFLAGVGMIGSRLAVPVVPVRLDGVHEILHKDWRLPRPGRARITFGPPMTLEGSDYAALSLRVEECVKDLRSR